MLNEPLLELITAAVDGELSPAETLRLRRELDASAEARAVFARLKSDSARLRALPPVPPPADLHRRVLAAVADVQPQPVPASDRQPLPVPPPATVPFAYHPRNPKAWRWVPAAVAASVLVGVAASSFLFFRQGGERPVARGLRPAAPGGITHPGGNQPGTRDAVPSAPFPHQPGAGTAVAGSAVPTDGANPAEAVAVAPAPRSARPDLLGGALQPETRFDRVELRIPFLKPLAEFDREDTRQLLAEELALDPAFRIDLFARNPARAVELFRTAAGASHVHLRVDATAQAHLQKRSTNAVVIYTESLTPAELAALFGKLCAEDAKVSPRVFDALHAVPVSSADDRELRVVLGTDPGLFKRPKAEAERHTKPGLDGKPISAGTADHIVKSITAGQGKGGEKSAVLTTWWPLANRTPPLASVELKSYLTNRGDRKPDVVPVMIVIRPAN
jgi:hypothetical protein